MCLRALDALDMNSCAIDVVVIRGNGGTLRSTPFIARLGKTWTVRQARVRVEVNGNFVAEMSLGDKGWLHWEAENLGPMHESTDSWYPPFTIPNHETLASMALRNGRNTVCYVSLRRGCVAVTITSNVYLWSCADRIIVSDIDGTLTRTDIWGHILPTFGKDWSHPGVCALFSKISENGYKFLYLSSRSASIMERTRRYISSLEQDGHHNLPDGPIFTNPERIFSAISHNNNAEKFKISCLQSIIDTFPCDSMPLYAGFGNRSTDTQSYIAARIPPSHIYEVNENSQVRILAETSNYTKMIETVHRTFPAIKTDT